MAAVSNIIRKALQGLKIERILLKTFTNDICEELERLNEGNYVVKENKTIRYLSRIYLIILFLLILAGMPS